MIVHGHPVSPFVRKVAAFAAEKGVALTTNIVMANNPDPEFKLMSPFGKIPGFEDGDYKLSDSSAIVHYIEAKHPEHNLIPAEAKARGRTIWYDEFADTIIFGPAGTIFFNRIVAPLMGRPADLDAAAKAEAEGLPPILSYLEGVMPGSGFLVEDRLTLADIAVASPFVNLAHAGTMVDAAAYPKLSAYINAIHARPSFAACMAFEKKVMGR